MGPIIKKLNVIKRNTDEYKRDSKHSLIQSFRNYNPDLHPGQQGREYKLALNATKLERLFAKPFIGELPHEETITAMAPHPSQLSSIYTGTADGTVRLWNTRTRKPMWCVQGHTGQVWSVTPDHKGESFYTVGHDKAIKCWSYDDISRETDMADIFKGAGAADHLKEPKSTWHCSTVVTGLSHHRYNQEFLTCGQRVLLWQPDRNVPIRSFDWNDVKRGQAQCSAIAAKFNKVECNLFASCDQDNNLVLYDLRDKAVSKLKMKLRLNDLCWNPMQAFVLTAVSDDYNAYTYDVRMMDKVSRILYEHRGHTRAAISVSYSPTGREFVTGSHDMSIRIFPSDDSRSREVYHTKRMHRVECVLFSHDSKFVYSGSSDHNVRIWKSNASEKLGPMTNMERNALQASAKLKEKYAHMPEIRRIARHRRVPKSILGATKEYYRIRSSQKRKEINRKEHSKPGAHQEESALAKPVFGLQDVPSTDEEEEEEEIERLREFVEEKKRKRKSENKERRRKQRKTEKESEDGKSEVVDNKSDES